MEKKVMGRHASDFTKCVIKLLVESKGQITHEEARPLLSKMGQPIKPVPEPELSHDVINFESQLGDKQPDQPDARYEADVAAFRKEYLKVRNSHEFQTRNNQHLGVLRQIAGKNLGWKPERLEIAYYQTMLREHLVRKEYKSERNSFDVTKSNWRKSLNGSNRRKSLNGSNRRKSDRRKISTPKVASVTVLAPTATPTEYEREVAALRSIDAHGGIGEVTKMIHSLLEEKRRELADAEKLLEELEIVKRLRERLAA